MTTPSPSKPKPTSTSTATLVDHYNSQRSAYNNAIQALDEKRRPEAGEQLPLSLSDDGACFVFDKSPDPNPEFVPIDRKWLVDEIRRQNLRLGRHIKARSHELLLHHRVDSETGKKVLKDDKYTVGYTYQEVLDILAEEFPEASTSVACLRWYVVHMRDDANREGLEWPDLPQYRPRSKPRRA